MEPEQIIKEYFNVGAAGLIVIVCLYIVLKYAPKVITGMMERQKRYDAMLETVITTAQQGNAVIERNNILMDKTTAVIERNTLAYKALERWASDIKAEVKKQTDTSVEMSHSIQIMLERYNRRDE